VILRDEADGGAADPVGPADRLPDPDSSAWLSRLRANGAERVSALAELHVLLHGGGSARASAPVVAGRARGLRDDLATQAADHALTAVLERLDDHRGESRFTTWAWKFAFYEACAAVGRRSWLRREGSGRGRRLGGAVARFAFWPALAADSTGTASMLYVRSSRVS